MSMPINISEYSDYRNYTRVAMRDEDERQDQAQRELETIEQEYEYQLEQVADQY